MDDKSRKTIVAMSGGVDSSMAAVLLLEQGYDIHGMFLRTWRPGQSKNHLTEVEASAIESASNIANAFHVPFDVVDVRERFREKVIAYFLNTYAIGQTPNPCVFCNRMIKWAVLLEQAHQMEANYVATGHYARTRRLPNGIVQLREARDPSKDQVYFLSNLTQAQLRKSLFPVGEYLKSEIREMARKKGLNVAKRSDSQDLCFLEDISYAEFLQQYTPDRHKAGDIVSEDGSVLGTHKGLGYYTIGQRKGLGIASKRPLYVLEKRLDLNQIVVGEADVLGKDAITLQQLHWIEGAFPVNKKTVEVKIRYKTNKKHAAIMQLTENHCKLKFEEKLRDITPGQFAVFYDGDIVLGNGVIVE